MSSYSSISGHRNMVFDEVRNSAYVRAIRSVLKPGDTVLDLGAGLGTHGLCAAAAGAGRVYLVDRESVVEVAKRVADENKLDARVICIQGRLQEVEIPEEVDLILSVFTGNFLLTEDLLPTLFEARDRYLAPGGRLLPDRGVMHVVPVEAEDYHQHKIGVWSAENLGLDFSPARPFAANWVYYEKAANVEPSFLSEPSALMELDFMSAESADCRAETRCIVEKAGQCHGLLGWFDMRLGEEWLSTSPDADQTHWSQAFLPLDPPLAVERGDELAVRINRPEYGEWSWAVSCGGERREHSTFLSRPVSRRDVAMRAESYRPGLNRRGEAARYLLSRMDRETSASLLAGQLVERFPDVFSTAAEARRFVRSLVAGFGD